MGIDLIALQGPRTAAVEFFVHVVQGFGNRQPEVDPVQDAEGILRRPQHGLLLLGRELAAFAQQVVRYEDLADLRKLGSHAQGQDSRIVQLHMPGQQLRHMPHLPGMAHQVGVHIFHGAHQGFHKMVLAFLGFLGLPAEAGDILEDGHDASGKGSFLGGVLLLPVQKNIEGDPVKMFLAVSTGQGQLHAVEGRFLDLAFDACLQFVGGLLGEKIPGGLAGQLILRDAAADLGKFGIEDADAVRGTEQDKPQAHGIVDAVQHLLLVADDRVQGLEVGCRSTVGPPHQAGDPEGQQQADPQAGQQADGIDLHGFVEDLPVDVRSGQGGHQHQRIGQRGDEGQGIDVIPSGHGRTLFEVQRMGAGHACTEGELLQGVLPQQENAAPVREKIHQPELAFLVLEDGRQGRVHGEAQEQAADDTGPVLTADLEQGGTGLQGKVVIMLVDGAKGKRPRGDGLPDEKIVVVIVGSVRGAVHDLAAVGQEHADAVKIVLVGDVRQQLLHVFALVQQGKLVAVGSGIGGAGALVQQIGGQGGHVRGEQADALRKGQRVGLLQHGPPPVLQADLHGIDLGQEETVLVCQDGLGAPVDLQGTQGIGEQQDQHEKHEADADAQPFAHEMMRLGREVGIGSVHGLLVCFFASHVGPA